MRRYWLIIIIVSALCGCARKAVICGVPYTGCTPWQLAASIHDNGDGTFVPVSVDQITSTKAYISGYMLADEQPAQIVCDIENGKVTNAILHTKND